MLFPLPLGEGARRAGEGKTLSRIASSYQYRHPVLDTGSQGLSKGDDVAIADRAMLVRNDGKQQTETNSSHKRSFASLKMTSVGHSEQREESHKLDCFTPSHKTILNRFVRQSVRNDVKEIFPRPLREREQLCEQSELQMRVRGDDVAIADRASLVRNDVTTLVPSKRIAFTLAEVLVTLGIIGVVSAMTLPTLVKNHQRKVFVTQLHKVYNELSQAYEQVITDHNAVNIKESGLQKNGSEWFLRNYFKTVKICLNGNEADCFANEYTNLDGTTLRLRSFLGDNGLAVVPPAAAILNDGAAIFLVNGGISYILVDVNGKQGPNILGRDMFDMKVDSNGTLVVEGDIETLASNFSTVCSSATDTGVYGACMAKIINDGWKMDY